MENMLTEITNYLLRQGWQIAVFCVVAAVVSVALKNKSAHVRYLLWLIVLAKCLVPALYTIPLAVLPGQGVAEPVVSSAVEAPVISVEAVEVTTTGPYVSPSVLSMPPRVVSLRERLAEVSAREGLGFVWIVGAVVFVLVAVGKALRTNRWLRGQRKPLSAQLQSGIEKLFADIGVADVPKVWLIEGVGQPFVWGLVRGSIYLPGNFGKVNGEKDRRGVLGHELSHVMRFDAAVNVLQIIAQAVYWFHPFVWWANKRIRAEREKCCDEMAIARLGAEAKDYSRAIVNTLIAEHEAAWPIPSLAVAGPVKNIEDRIKTIMRSGKKFYRRPTFVTIVTVLLLAGLAVPTTLALTERSEKKSETADVKTKHEKPQASSKTQPLLYGPVIERVVNSESVGKDFFIDFDTGEVLSPPEEPPGGPNPFETWLQQTGVDAEGSVGGRGNIKGLACFDMIVIPVDKASWSDPVKASYFEQFITWGKPGSPVFMSGKGKLPVTYLFKTREGGMGLLQITGFTDSPKGVKIRYKMEQAKAEEIAWGAAVEGLRCRWAGPVKAVAAGTAPVIALEVENVSDNPIIWQCRSEHTWRIYPRGSEGKGEGVYRGTYSPKFRVVPGEGVRLAGVDEARRNHEGAGSAVGYYRLGPGARMRLISEYLWVLPKAGQVKVDGYLNRRNPGGGGAYPAEMVLRNRISCPALVLEVTAGDPAAERAYEVVWSAPVDGLQAGIKYEYGKRPISYFRDVELSIVVRNITEEPIAVTFSPTGHYDDLPRVRDKDGREQRVEMASDYERYPPGTVTLAPGFTGTIDAVAFSVCPKNYGGQERRGPILYADPGKYTITRVFRYNLDGGKELNKELTVGPIELEVAGPGEQPSDVSWGEVVEGVQIRRRAERNIFRERSESEERLHKLALAVKMYGDDHDGGLADGLKELKAYMDEEQEFKWVVENVAYVGKGKNLNVRGATRVPVAYDKALLEKANGTNVLFLDFSVRFLDLKDLQDFGIVDETTERLESAKKLKGLGKALFVYANDQEAGKYPDTLEELGEQDYINRKDLAWYLENVEYLGKGKTAADPPNAVIAYDKTLLEKSNSTNVLYNDSHVAFRGLEQLKKLGLIRPEKRRVATGRVRSGADVYKQLERIVDLSGLGPEMSFGEALEELKNSVEPALVIVVLWRDLEEKAEIDRNTAINMDPIPAVRLGTALELLLKSISAGDAELGYVVRDGVIVIATKESLPKKLETRVYDISGLVGGAGEQMKKAAIAIESRFLMVSDNFLEDIGLDVDVNGIWGIGGEVGHISRGPFDGGLVVSGFRKEDSNAVSDSAVSRTSKGHSLMLDEFQAGFLLRAVAAYRGSRVLAAPKVRVLEGEEAVLRVKTETEYISGYSEPNGSSEEPEPKRDSVSTGTIIQVTPRLTPDSRQIILELAFEVSNIIGFEKRMYKAKHPYEIPETEVISTEARVSVPNGGTVLIGGKKVKTENEDGQIEEKNLLVLIKAEIVEQEDTEVG